MENVAVIIRLPVEPAIGTDLQPFLPMFCCSQEQISKVFGVDWLS